MTRVNALRAEEPPAQLTALQVAAAVASFGADGEGTASLQLGPVSSLRALCCDGLAALAEVMSLITTTATAPASCLAVVIACVPTP